MGMEARLPFSTTLMLLYPSPSLEHHIDKDRCQIGKTSPCNKNFFVVVMSVPKAAFGYLVTVKDRCDSASLPHVPEPIRVVTLHPTPHRSQLGK